MRDEHWLRELAQVNREQQQDEQSRLDERWDRLSRGALSPEEEAELRALAETSEEDRAAYEAFRPLGPELHAGVVQAIRAQAPAPPAKLLPFRRRATGWAVAALATAASVAVLLRPLPPLPAYSPPEVSRGVSAFRGEDPELPRLAPGDPFQVVVRPQTAVSRASRLEALCVLARGRELHPVQVRSEIDPGGSIKMEGAIERGFPPGTWTLWAVVGRPGKLPDPAALETVSPRAQVRQRDWIAVSEEVRIEPRDQPR